MFLAAHDIMVMMALEEYEAAALDSALDDFQKEINKARKQLKSKK